MSRLPRPLSRLLAGVQRLAKVLEHRRAAQALLHLDARGLKDIGLTRNAVEGALDLPLHQDPTLLLSRIAAREVHEPSGRESAVASPATEPEKARSSLGRSPLSPFSSAVVPA